MPGSQVPPVIKTKELRKGVEGMGIRQTVVFDFPPHTFEGDVAKRYSGLVADQLAELKEVLIGPGITVAPARLLFEHFLNLPDQAFIRLHTQKGKFSV